MARRIEKAKAIELRRQGKTYNEINDLLGISKSTLSGWLCNYPLTKQQIDSLSKHIKERKIIRIEKTSRVRYLQIQKRIKQDYENAKRKLLPLTKKELYLLGLFLYWGEGTKGFSGRLSLNNTDPKVVKFYYYWLTKILRVKKEKIKVLVHLYKDMKIEESLNYWSEYLGIPRDQFNKPYNKDSLRSNLTQKGFGHGTCCVNVCNKLLKNKIMAGIDVLGNLYGQE